MNKTDQAKIVQIRTDLEHIVTQLNGFHAEAEAQFDDLSETAQEGARGEALSCDMEALSEAIASIEAAVEQLESLA